MQSANSSKVSFLTFPFILVFLEVITFLSTDMYLPALPFIAEEFRTSQELAQYTQTLWFLGATSMQLLLGPITEKFGRKRVLIIGISLFILASFCCATTTNMPMFLLSRFIQGTTVCVVIVAGYATIHELYSGQRAIQILAIMGSVTILAPALGPIMGAIIISYTDWHNIFVLLTICAMFGLLGVYWVMPSDSIKNLANSTAQNYFINSLKDYKLIFSNKVFMRYALINSFIIICFFIWIVQSPFIIIATHQQSTIYFGLAQLVVFSSFIFGSQSAKYLITKMTAQKLCDCGIFLIIMSSGLFLGAAYLKLDIRLILIGMLGIAFGAAMLSGLWNRLAIESCEQPMTHRVAVYSTIVSLSASLGSYLVIFLKDQDFLSMAMLMLCFIILAVNIYLNVRSRIELKN